MWCCVLEGFLLCTGVCVCVCAFSSLINSVSPCATDSLRILLETTLTTAHNVACNMNGLSAAGNAAYSSTAVPLHAQSNYAYGTSRDTDNDCMVGLIILF